MRTRLALIAATFFAGGLGMSAAEQPLPPGGWGQPAANITSTVRQFELTPTGEPEGFILDNGTEVHLPPHLTQQLAAAVRSGDQVTVRGWRSDTPDFIIGTSVTDARTGRSVVDQGPPSGMRPPPPPPGQPAPGAQWATVQGRVGRYLHGPKGEINGLLLDNGTELKLPPPAAYQVSVWVQPGQTVVAQGYLLSNAFGRVMSVLEVGPSLQRLAQVGWMVPHGHGRQPPPPPAPGAP